MEYGMSNQKIQLFWSKMSEILLVSCYNFHFKMTEVWVVTVVVWKRPLFL